MGKFIDTIINMFSDDIGDIREGIIRHCINVITNQYLTYDLAELYYIITVCLIILLGSFYFFKAKGYTYEKKRFIFKLTVLCLGHIISVIILVIPIKFHAFSFLIDLHPPNPIRTILYVIFSSIAAISFFSSSMSWLDYDEDEDKTAPILRELTELICLSLVMGITLGLLYLQLLLMWNHAYNTMTFELK